MPHNLPLCMSYREQANICQWMDVSERQMRMVLASLTECILHNVEYNPICLTEKTKPNLTPVPTFLVVVLSTSESSVPEAIVRRALGVGQVSMDFRG